MTKEALGIIVAKMKAGKIFYSQDRVYADGGDIRARVIRYNDKKEALVYESYDLTPNGDYLNKTELVVEDELLQFIPNDYEEALSRLTDKKIYPFID